MFSPCHCVGGGRNSHPPQSIRSATSSSASPTFTRSFHVIIEYRLQSIYISLSFLTGGPIELQSLIVRGNARSIKLLCRSACTELLAWTTYFRPYICCLVTELLESNFTRRSTYCRFLSNIWLSLVLRCDNVCLLMSSSRCSGLYCHTSPKPLHPDL